MNTLESYIPSLIALSPLLAISAYLTLKRPYAGPAAASGRFLLSGILAVAAQSVHFTEELAWDLAGRLPESFGFDPMDRTAFVAFNIGWLAVWALSVLGVRKGSVLALFPLWFLSIAAIFNLPAHLLLATRSGGYFPGVVTAPFIAAAGVFLLIEMVRVTK